MKTKNDLDRIEKLFRRQERNVKETFLRAATWSRYDEKVRTITVDGREAIFIG